MIVEAIGRSAGDALDWSEGLLVSTLEAPLGWLGDRDEQRYVPSSSSP